VFLVGCAEVFVVRVPDNVSCNRNVSIPYQFWYPFDMRLLYPVRVASFHKNVDTGFHKNVGTS